MSMVHSMEGVSLVEFDHMVSIARDGHRCLSIRLSDRFPDARAPLCPLCQRASRQPPYHPLIHPTCPDPSTTLSNRTREKILILSVVCGAFEMHFHKKRSVLSNIVQIRIASPFLLGEQLLCQESYRCGGSLVHADVCMCVCHLKSEQYLAALLHWAKQPSLNLKFNVG